MIHPLQKRLWIIAFFLGLNIAFGSYFLVRAQPESPIALPRPFAQLLLLSKTAPPGVQTIEDITHPKPQLPDLDARALIKRVNEHREKLGYQPLETDPALDAVVADLFNTVKQNEYDTNTLFAEGVLEKALREGEYSYEWVTHNALEGPVSNNAVITAWLSDARQLEMIENDEFEHIAITTRLVDVPKRGTIGVVVQLLAKPRAVVVPAILPADAPQRAVPAKTAREIPDEEVVAALNDYRATHSRRALSINDNLCVYAAKRAEDLRQNGQLDAHAGFIADFEDPSDPPTGIREYGRSGRIAENLAHQFCRNMTTGDSFVAESGTALIEWCFDSSTAGHREAQLDASFRNVCVRHADNMYVVIFGE